MGGSNKVGSQIKQSRKTKLNINEKIKTNWNVSNGIGGILSL
jgi:hypothetical protein